MLKRYTRRDFLCHSSAAAAAATLIRPSRAQGQSLNERVNLACVGVGGKGWSDSNGCAKAGANIVAFCDVECGSTKRKGGYGAAAEAWPQARQYTDWREMLDKEHKNIDGLTVSTPDHMHAPVTMSALHLGLGTYTQKPMTRTVYEARQLRLAAAKAGVATQMGNQHHSGIGYRMLAQMIQTGAIGKIKEAHAWSNRPIWPQGIERPAGADPVPESLNWDLWLGVAPERPYLKGVYHPFNWRGWYDFGSGALGDMGCHIIDPVVWSLDLGPPTSIRCEGPEPKTETFPEREVLHYEFPGTKFTADRTINVKWYDGGNQPPRELVPLPEGSNLPKNGTLFIGEKGAVLTSHGGGPMLLPREQFAGYEKPKLDRLDHYGVWLAALRGEGRANSDFSYAGPLTETVLLGTIACRFPNEKLEWNSADLKFANVSQANHYVHREYRKGWEVEGLS